MIVHSLYGAACSDCGAGTGAPCNDDCPTRAQLDHEQVLAESHDDLGACRPSPSYAAATLCGCGGSGTAVAS